MAVIGFGHAAYFVRDLERAVRFYVTILGFERAFELADERGGTAAVYLRIRERQFIELFPAGEGETGEIGHPRTGYSHLCLEVDDIEGVADRLRCHGVLESGPNVGKSGSCLCWARDPDGNRIEFMQVIPDSMQYES